MLSITNALVSAVTWNGLASQHQSPSRNTLFGKSCLSCWHTVVFPTPIVPLIIYKVFIILTCKFKFVKLIISHQNLNLNNSTQIPCVGFIVPFVSVPYSFIQIAHRAKHSQQQHIFFPNREGRYGVSFRSNLLPLISQLQYEAFSLCLCVPALDLNDLGITHI